MASSDRMDNCGSDVSRCQDAPVSDVAVVNGGHATKPAVAAVADLSRRSDSHIPALDAVRGIAILMVLLYHCNYPPSAGAGWLATAIYRVLRLGGAGVDLFFVLSGFLITGILFDTKQSAHYFRNFYIRRTLRIFPLYYGVLIVSFLILPLFGVRVDSDASENQVWLWFYATNFAQAWHEFSSFFGTFSHFWSLAIEEHFYLVWPCVIFFCTRKTALWACAGCIAIATVCRLALLVSGDHSVAVYVLTPCRMDALAAGACLALVARGPHGTARLGRWAILGVVIAGVILAVLFQRKIDLPRMDSSVLALRFSLSIVICAAVVLSAINAAPTTWVGRFWNNGLLRFFGKYSYALYVFHYPLGPLFGLWFPAETLATYLGSELGGTLAHMALVVAMSSLLAVASWHLYEKHFLRLKDVLAPHPTSASAATRVATI